MSSSNVHGPGFMEGNIFLDEFEPHIHSMYQAPQHRNSRFTHPSGWLQQPSQNDKFLCEVIHGLPAN